MKVQETLKCKEERRLLGCGAVWLLLERTFHRKLSPPSSGWIQSERYNNDSSNQN
jgi:hypothetical protein